MRNYRLKFKIFDFALSFCILIFAFWIFTAAPAFAADVFFDATSKQFPQGGDFLLSVFLNTERHSINAVEGRLVFPSELLDMLEVRDGDSAVTFWIKKPQFLTSNTLEFSGITPGGLLGTKQFLFAVLFRAKRSGDGTVMVNELQVLQNDGYGTRARITSTPFLFSISTGSAPSRSVVEPMQDAVPPEDFTPVIIQNRDVFEGKNVLVFSAQDKGSGIDHYEVREGSLARYGEAESPFLLQNQALDKKILVKAVDKNGNERVVIIPARVHSAWWENYVLVGILIVFGLLAFYGIVVRKSKIKMEKSK